MTLPGIPADVHRALVAHLLEQRQRLARRQRPAAPEERLQVLALQVLHRHPGELALRVDARRDHLDDVVAADARAHPRLVDEELSVAPALEDVGVKHLERAAVPRAPLLDLVHRPHAAARDQADDGEIPGEGLALAQRPAVLHRPDATPNPPPAGHLEKN
jgi:hypothetical protein